MNACPPSWLTFSLPKRRVGRGFSGVEERATRFAWPRAINAHAHTHVCTCSHETCVLRRRRMIRTWLRICAWLRVLRMADPLAWIIKVLNLVSHCGLIITSEHHMRVGALAPLQACATFAHIHGGSNSVIKWNCFSFRSRGERLIGYCHQDRRDDDRMCLMCSRNLRTWLKEIAFPNILQ